MYLHYNPFVRSETIRAKFRGNTTSTLVYDRVNRATLLGKRKKFSFNQYAIRTL